MQNHASTLAAEFKLDAARVAATVALIDEGNTIPFIARYRKEATGSMDDQTLRALDERLSYLRKLDDQKETVHNSITEQGAMTPEIAAALEKAKTLAEVEDIYRPYKPKRKTRASIARARGLEPLAARLLEQRPEDEPALLARQYITEEVPDTEAALAGARDILAEGFSDSANLRATLRSLYNATALVESKAAKKDTDSVYSGYYDYSEPAAKMAGHRILAVDRGEREGFLKVSVTVDAARAVRLLTERTVKNDSPSAEQVHAAAEDAYVRLIHPSLEREVRAGLTERACEGAISVFSKNLRQLLLQPPIKGKVALGLDPGYRMGCKTAVVDATGKVLDTVVIYPTAPQNRVEESKKILKNLIRKYNVSLISVGNGTASRESEQIIVDLLKEIKEQIHIPLVADIHFDYRLAVAAIENGADKIRINPGNIGSRDRIKAVVDKAAERGIPIRVGVNSGSLEKEILAKYGGVTAEGLVESALDKVAVIEDLGYRNLVISIKSSDVMMCVKAHELIAQKTDYPLHVGITEAGTLTSGNIKSSVGLGIILYQGIGDTIRVSLTGDPVEEVKSAKLILKTLGLRTGGIEVVSCPTCGRTRIDLISLANQVETMAAEFDELNIKLAVMGCVVNGPGEAREADLGIAGGVGEGLLIRKGEIIRKVPENELLNALRAELCALAGRNVNE